MAIVVIVMMVLVCTAKAAEATHKHHFKFPKPEDRKQEELFKKEICTSQHDRLLNEVIEKSKCGEPKEVFVELKLQVSYLQVSPSAVWVKQCVGLCEATGSKCVATKKRTEHIPVRIYNSKTNRDMCSTYPVEVHETCGCCSVSAGDCEAPRVYNPPEPAYEVESF